MALLLYQSVVWICQLMQLVMFLAYGRTAVCGSHLCSMSGQLVLYLHMFVEDRLGFT